MTNRASLLKINLKLWGFQMLAFAAYKEDDYRSEKDSRKTKGIDRSADSGMWTERPLLSPRLPKKPPTTCSTRETIICTIPLSLSRTHRRTHTYTQHKHTSTVLSFIQPKYKHSYNKHTHTCRYIFTKSFIILLLAALSISCALSAPTSTALPVG